jgi:hypothetical protein
MDKFQEIIDTYISNYNSYNKGKIDFECECGEVIFYKDYKNPNVLIIFGLYIKPEYREKGYCRSIFQYIIDNNSNTFKWLCIQSVISKVLYEYLLRFKYKNKNFYLKRDGFYLKL